MHSLEKTLESAGSLNPALFVTPHFFGPHSWVELDSAALAHNIGSYRSVVGPHVALAPVIKGNAYGHGMVEVGKLINNNPTIARACVARLSEARILRESGFTKPILVLSIIDDNPTYAILHDIALVAANQTIATQLNHYALKLGKKALLHLKVDTGLSRMGTLWTNAATFVEQCVRLDHCIIEGIFTHFANSENKDLTYAHTQVARFNELLSAIENKGIAIPLQHAACSASQTVLPTSHYTMARFGIGLYGLWPSSDNHAATTTQFPFFTLRPVMTWKTRILMIKTIGAGQSIGYDLSFKTARQTQVAVLAVGYADGYNRQLSNKGVVKIKDGYAPVVGRVSMNLMMVDVTDIAGVTEDDEVILLGDDPRINPQTIAQLCNTINYEVTTNICPTLTRKVINNSQSQ